MRLPPANLLFAGGSLDKRLLVPSVPASVRGTMVILTITMIAVILVVRMSSVAVRILTVSIS